MPGRYRFGQSGSRPQPTRPARWLENRAPSSRRTTSTPRGGRAVFKPVQADWVEVILFGDIDLTQV